MQQSSAPLRLRVSDEQFTYVNRLYGWRFAAKCDLADFHRRFVAHTFLGESRS